MNLVLLIYVVLSEESRDHCKARLTAHLFGPSSGMQNHVTADHVAHIAADAQCARSLRLEINMIKMIFRYKNIYYTHIHAYAVLVHIYMHMQS